MGPSGRQPLSVRTGAEKGVFIQHREASFYRLICQHEGSVAWLHVNWGVGLRIINNSGTREKISWFPFCRFLVLFWSCYGRAHGGVILTAEGDTGRVW